MLLHASACAFYTGILLTQSSLYTQKLLHKYSYAEMVPTRNAFVQTRLLHTDIFVQRSVFLHSCFFFGEMLVHAGAFRLGHFEAETV